MNEKDTRFIKGAFILTVSGIIVKIIGALYRIPLYQILGSEGMGLFQMAYPIYSILLTVSSSGLNVAISKVVAEKRALGDWSAARAAFSVSMFLMVCIGSLGSVLLYASSGWIAAFLAKDIRARFSIMAISPAILLAGILSSLRGWFQGIEEMRVPAVSQVIEAVGRLITMFFLAKALLPRGVEYAASGATFGAATGAFLGVLYSYIVYVTHSHRWKKNDGELKETWTSIVNRVLSVAIPVSMASAVFGITELIDLGVVPGRLHALGFSPEVSTKLYGQLTGAALPLLNVITVVTGALQISLVPSISSAWVLNDRWAVKRRVRKALAITGALAVPAFLGLYVLADPIPKLLYNDTGVGPIMRSVAPGILFLAFQQVSSAILQGIGEVKVPLYNLIWAALAKVILIFVLMPVTGIVGAGIATSSYFAVAAVLNLFFVKRLLGDVLDLWTFFKTCAAGLLMSIVVALVYAKMILTGWKIATIVSIGVGVGVYGCLSLIMGVVSQDDLETFPGLGTLIQRFKRR